MQAVIMPLFFQVTALVILPMTLKMWGLSAGFIFGGFFVFLIMSKAGQMLLEREEEARNKEVVKM